MTIVRRNGFFFPSQEPFDVVLVPQQKKRNDGKHKEQLIHIDKSEHPGDIGTDQIDDRC